MAEDPSGRQSEGGVALRAALERSAGALQRFASALTGSREVGRALVIGVLADAARAGAGDLERVRLFEALKRRGALHLDRERRRGQLDGGERVRPPLSELRPTEREALLLRYVAGLSRAEVAAACGVDEAAAAERLSSALLHACRPEAGPAAEPRRRAAEQRLVELLDGLAPDDLADFAASDDVTRDLVHDAERKVEWIHALEPDATPDLAALEAEILAAMSPGDAAPVGVREAKPAPLEAVHEEPMSEAARAPAPGGETAPAPAPGGETAPAPGGETALEPPAASPGEQAGREARGKSGGPLA